MKKVGIVACSDAQKTEYKVINDNLFDILRTMGYELEISEAIYEDEKGMFCPASKRASELMRMFEDDDIEEIYDISGGDIANQILDHLDFDVIKKSRAVFWGYSDLSTIINAIYTKTGKESVLYQVKNMSWGKYNKLQQERFKERTELFEPEIEFLQGNSMEGVVVGGNIRCFLKLAGTEYFPDLTGKILLLEAMSGETYQMIACLSQLKQLGAFDKASGILLGTFTAMHEKNCSPDIYTLVKEFAGSDIPIARTYEIGHGKDSKAITIGRKMCKKMHF